MPRISVLIVNYNTKDLITLCIDSLLDVKAQDFSLEIIVVDNASTDGSTDALKKLQAESKIQFIENEKNVGFGKANNQAFERAGGDYIFLLNPDARLTEDVLQNLLSFYKSTQDCGIAAPQLLFEDGTIQASCYNLPTISRAIQEFFLGKDGSYSKYYPKTANATEVEAVVGAAILLSRNTIEQLGMLFNESFFLYYEDIDLCRRMKRIGKKIYYIPGARVIHAHGASASKAGDWAYKQNKKSARIYFGTFQYYLITFILYTGQKWLKLWKKSNQE